MKNYITFFCVTVASCFFAQAPVVSFSASSHYLCVGSSNNSVSFTDLSSNSPTAWQWHVINSGGYMDSSFVASPTFTFPTQGASLYAIFHSCTNAAGQSDTIYQTVMVGMSPMVSAVANPTLVCDYQNSTLTAFGAVSYTWNPQEHVGNPITVNFPGISNHTFTVTGADSHGCTATAVVTIFVTDCTDPIPNAIAEQQATAVDAKIYPNPCSDKLFIDFSGDSPEEIEIDNLQGEMLEKQSAGLKSKIEIDVNGLKAGMYLLKIKGNKAVKSCKLIKE